MDALFHELTEKPGVWVRRCYGLESLAGISSDTLGLSHSTVSAQVTLPTILTSTDVKSALRRTLARLRHAVPLIAARVSKLPAPTYAYQLSYTVPTSTADVLQWADEILVFTETGNGESLNANHERLSRDRAWGGSAGRYSIEFHVRPLEEGTGPHRSWIISLSGHHANCDARSSWMILDAFFSFLSSELTSTPPSLDDLAWGPETTRLAPASYMIWSLSSTGTPEPLPPPSIPDSLALVEERVLWIYQPMKYECSLPEGQQWPHDVKSAVVFTKAETARLHAACKAHGRTVTQVVAALASVANAEATLVIARQKGNTEWKDTLESFKKATHISAANIVDMRSRLPEAYRKLTDPHGTPLCAIDSTHITYSLAPFRQLLSVNSESGVVTRNADDALFWDGIVREIAEGWKAAVINSEGYRNTAVGQDALSCVESTSLDLEPFFDTAPIFNSVGDLGRLGLLNAFLPPSPTKSAQEPRITRGLVVDDVDSTPRTPMPAVNSAFFEYDGRFRMKMIVGGKWATQADMQLRTDTFKAWFDVLF